VDGALFFGQDVAALIDRAAQHVHDAAQGAGTHGHRNRCAGVGHGHAAAQAVGRTHGDGPHDTVAQLLLDLERQALFRIGGGLVGQGERVVDVGDAVAGELNVHHGADALNDGTVAHV